MRHAANRGGTISAARRGQIVQRVIVDGWTITRAAAAFDASPRLVAIWVAAYRRHGMASLRRTARRSVIAERLELWLLRPPGKIWGRVSSGLHRLFAPGREEEPASMQAFRDNNRGGGAS